jgi:hypothetical protein
MFALALYLFSLQPALAPSPCEQVGPRLDGSYVTVCQGTVVGVRDTLGNSRRWDPATNTVVVSAPGRRPLVIRPLR